MKLFSSIFISHHAKKRMRQRAINLQQVQQALLWGRETYQNLTKSYIYFVGYRECREAKKEGVDLCSVHGLTAIVKQVKGKEILVTVWWNRAPNRFYNNKRSVGGYHGL